MNLSDLTFEEFIRIWARVALLLVLVEAYLTVNKIWIRKHERVVSDSVSVSAQLLALATGAPFIGLYVMEGAYEGAIGDGIFLIVNVIMIAIGIGFWVEGRRGLGFLKGLSNSLRLEKSEAHTLLSNFFRPVGATQVIRILHGLASVDNHLDENELKFIRAFAEKWEIDVDDLVTEGAEASPDGEEAFSQLRILVEDYLRLSPPREQARHLRDVLSSLTSIDGNVSNEEELIMEEMGGLIDDYVGDTKTAGFAVLIAPQSHAQEVALKEILREHHKVRRLGGEVYTIGHYYSQAYADMVCGWYRDTGYLTINEELHDSNTETDDATAVNSASG